MDTLFFRCQPLCMSLNGVAADYSWSGGIQKIHRPLILNSDMAPGELTR